MADGTQFTIDVVTTGTAEAESAAAACARLANELTGAESAASKAAEAAKAGVSSFNQTEAAANKAAVALEKVNQAVATQAGKATAAAAEYGVFSSQYAKASEKLQQLTQRQAEAAAKAATTEAAMKAEGAALEGLEAAAAKTAKAQETLAKAHDQAKKAADAQKKSSADQKKATNDAAEALGKLGGPVGVLGQKLFSAKATVGKLNEAFGESKGQSIAAAAGIASVAAAAAAAALAIGVAAVVGIAAITSWAIKLADKDKQIEKMAEKAKKSFARIFGGLNIKPLNKELEKMVSIFDEGTATSKALQAVFNSLFQPIVDGITALVPKLVTGFIKFEILVLKALIAIKPFGAVFEAVGLGILIVVGAIAILVAAFVAAGVLIVAAFAALIALPFYIVDLFKFLGSGISSAITAATDWISQKFGEVMDWLSGLSWSEIGMSLIQGLIDGLLGGGGGLMSAITGLMGSAIGAAKSALGIASPSKVFAEIGGNTAEGMSQGVDEGAPAVQNSMTAMADPAAAASAAGTSTSTSTSTSTTGGAVYNITITEAGFTIEALRALFADLGAQAGTAVPVAT